MRGFIGGIVIGLVTLAIAVVGLALLAPATPRPDVADNAPLSAAGTSPASERAGVTEGGGDNDLIELAPVAPGGQSEGQDNLAALAGADTLPAGKPVVGAATPGMDGQAGLGAVSDTPEINVDPDAPVVASPGAGLQAPQGNNATKALAGGDTNPGDQPSVGAATPGLSDPQVVARASGLDVQGDAPVSVPLVSGGLVAPGDDSTPTGLADPARPAVADGAQSGAGFGASGIDQDRPPEVAPFADAVPSPGGGDAGTLTVALAPGTESAPTPSTQSAAAPEPGAQQAQGIGENAAQQDRSPEVSTNPDPAPATAGVGAEPQAPGPEALPAVSTQSASVAASQSGPEPTPAPQLDQNTPDAPATPSGPQVATLPSPLPDPSGPVVAVPEVDQGDRVVPQAPTPDSETSGSQIVTLPQAGDGEGGIRPTIGKRIVPLTERNVIKVAEDQGENPPESPDLADADATPEPPIKAYGVAFENPDNRPLMAIVLIDDENSLGAEALADFPYPISFAVDPSDPGAADKIARHRAAGFEVVLLADLDPQATAQDAEVTLSVWLNALPGVVALLEGPKTGIQGNRDLSDQVTAIVGEAGLGLIMQARGLNTAFKLAARDGVPAALVFRDFDGAGQTPVVMRRFLDQAAFRAGQSGGVIMLGRLRPETISALLVWGLQDRVSRVAVVPVSAVLTRE